MSGVKTSIAVWRQIEKNRNGYSQGAKARWSAVIRWIVGVALSVAEAVKLIAKDAATDCSAAWAIGVDMAYGTTLHKGTVWTGNIAKLAKATGFFKVTRFNGNLATAVPGGALLEPYRHIVSVLDHGEVLSPEYDERGRTQGGRPGDQTGREVKIRKLYKRRPGEPDGGWTYNIVPISASEFKGRILYQFSKLRRSYADALAKLVVVASADGPLWRSFMKAWEKVDGGLAVAYDPATLTDVPDDRHAFVVLGGSITQMRRRLTPAIAGLRLFPNSKVLVTGGVKRGDLTEAEFMVEQLLSAGISADRIIVENRAGSTIQNAQFSLPLLSRQGIRACTIVSYESHLRRALILFMAAKLEIETKGPGAKPMTLQFGQPLAWKDKEIAATPASPATRAEIGKEVAYTLGVQKYFKG